MILERSYKTYKPLCQLMRGGDFFVGIYLLQSGINLRNTMTVMEQFKAIIILLSNVVVLLVGSALGAVV